jgi:hypothetical protein
MAATAVQNAHQLLRLAILAITFKADSFNPLLA